jgi:hypothetical protein
LMEDGRLSLSRSKMPTLSEMASPLPRESSSTYTDYATACAELGVAPLGRIEWDKAGRPTAPPPPSLK